MLECFLDQVCISVLCLPSFVSARVGTVDFLLPIRVELGVASGPCTYPVESLFVVSAHTAVFLLYDLGVCPDASVHVETVGNGAASLTVPLQRILRWAFICQCRIFLVTQFNDLFASVDIHPGDVAFPLRYSELLTQPCVRSATLHVAFFPQSIERNVSIMPRLSSSLVSRSAHRLTFKRSTRLMTAMRDITFRIVLTSVEPAIATRPELHRYLADRTDDFVLWRSIRHVQELPFPARLYCPECRRLS